MLYSITTLLITQTTPLRLGDAGDWATAIGLSLSVAGLLAAVWKLARAATKLEGAITVLTSQQLITESHNRKQWEAFQSFQRETNAAINELRLAVSKLTWEVGHAGSNREKDR